MTSTGSDRESRVARLLGALLCAVVLVGGAAAAERAAASQVPVTSATLMARSYATGAITSSFTSTSGAALSATTDACDQRWSVLPASPVNAMAITSTGSVAATISGVVTATVPVCGHTGVNAEVAGDLRTTGGGSSFGVLLHAAPGGRPATAAVFSSGIVTIQRISATGTVSSWSPTASVNNSNGARYLRLAYVDGVYTVFVNNASVLSYTATAAQRTEAEQNRSVGIVAISDTRTTFDNFQGYPR